MSSAETNLDPFRQTRPDAEPAAPARLGALLSAAAPYALAVACCAVALALALSIQAVIHKNLSVSSFLMAITITVWYGGNRAGVVALLLSCLAFDYYFIEPTHSFAVQADDVAYFVVFVVYALVIAWFAANRRAFERNLAASQFALRGEVAVRTQQAQLLDLTHDTIFVRDMDDRIRYWNRGAAEQYGWSADEAIGREAHALLETEFPLSEERIRSELLSRGRWEGELVTSRKDGSRIVVMSRWSLQRDERGAPSFILETNNDITERRRNEDRIVRLNVDLARRGQELEASNKELEAFAYSTSHDLRAPLRHIAGYSELLQKAAFPVLDAESRRYVAAVRDSAKKMGTLIDDLLGFSRIGRVEAQYTQVSLTQLAREAIAEVEKGIGNRDISWSVGDLPSVRGDRSLLRIAFVNLISNAVKFTGTRPQARIELGRISGAADSAVFFVRDNGVGFDMKYVHKLFGVFQRLHRPEAFEGTGIGLATVQRIIHRHGGQVWAEGALDAGATFFISLPYEPGSRS